MIVLASASNARKTLLQNTGLKFISTPADLDEQKITENLETGTQNIASELAKCKARHISKQRPGDLIIGADQTLLFENKILTKAKNKDNALENLKALNGKTHTLISAVCVVKNDKILWSYTDQAQLTMHCLSDDFLKNYIKTDPDSLTQCVGAYRIEGPGAWLFKKIEGDIFTIMGLPLLPLLNYFHTKQGITP